MLQRFAFLFLKRCLNLKYLQGRHGYKFLPTLHVSCLPPQGQFLVVFFTLFPWKLMKALFKIGIYFCNRNREGKNSFCFCPSGWDQLQTEYRWFISINYGYIWTAGGYKSKVTNSEWAVQFQGYSSKWRQMKCVCVTVSHPK